MGQKTAGKALFLDFFKTGNRKVQIVTICGITGILLIFLSQFLSFGKGGSAKSAPVESDSSAYVQALQAQLSTLIGQIDGAGDATVMVTLQNDWETLYVSEEKTDHDSTQTVSGEEIRSERQTREQSYVLVDGKDGRSALVKTRMEPVVKGVVVVCKGGDDPLTATRILEAVTTALAISSARVCITKCA